MFHYHAYGLALASEIELPELIQAQNETPVDVTIARGSVPLHLENPRKAGVRYQAAPGQLLLTVDGIARFLAQDGTRIIVEQAIGADDGTMRLFLLGTAIAAIVHQRGALAMHASAIEYRGTAVLFSGPSGVGKSTLAAAFARKGHRVLADDITVISERDGAGLWAWPGTPHTKLWADMLQELAITEDMVGRVRPELEKYRWSVDGNFVDRPLSVARVYLLQRGNNATITIDGVAGAERVVSLLRNTYRAPFVDGLGMAQTNFQLCATLGAQAVVRTVERPAKPVLLDELVAAIMSELDS